MDKKVRKKKICLVTSIKLENDSRTLKQAFSLFRNGYEICVIEIGKSNLSDFDIPFNLLSINNKYSFYKVEDYNANYKFQLIIRLINKCKKIYFYIKKIIYDFFFIFFFKTYKNLPNVDLFILHAPYQFFSIYKKTRKLGVKFIYDAHDYYSDDFFSGKKSFFYIIYWKILVRKLEKLSTFYSLKVITVSKGIKKILRNKFNVKPFVIRNQHDDRLDKIVDMNIREYLSLSEDNFIIVNVGNAKIGQPIENIINAVNLLPDKVKLVLIGKDYDKYIFNRKFNDNNKVFNIGSLKPYHIVNFIKNADLGIIILDGTILNYKYCLPNKIFQYVSAGIPFLHSDLYEINKLPQIDKIGIMIDPDSVDSIRNAIISLFSDRVRYQKLKKNINEIKHEYRWEKEERKFIKIIEKSISEI